MKSGFYTGRWSIFYRLNAKMTASIVVSLITVLGSSSFFIEKSQREKALQRARELGSFISSTIMVSLETQMLKNDRFAITTYLESMNGSEEIKSTSIMKADGQIVFSTNRRSVGMKISPGFISRHINADANQSITTGYKSGERILSVITKIPNKYECYGCHDKKTTFLGAMIVDISLTPTEKMIAGSRNRLIFSSGLAIITVSIILFLLNNRYIYTPVKKLNRVIEGVKKGDLSVKENYPIKDELGNLGCSLNSMVDSLNAANNQLRESYNKQLYQSEKLSAIGLLASGIIHEIQSPLTGIYFSLQLIRNDQQDAEVRNILDHIMIDINKPMRMARELLGFVKPSAPAKEYTDINELVESVLFFIGKKAEQQKVLVTKRFDQHLPQTVVDPDSLRQVFLNLMVNAVQAMPLGGAISIATWMSDRDKCIFVSFTDTGPGIPPEEVKELFKPFFTTKKSGTGLGLYMSKGIIGAHGGEITMETTIGAGSKFTVKIPLSDKGDACEVDTGRNGPLNMQLLQTDMQQE